MNSLVYCLMLRKSNRGSTLSNQAGEKCLCRYRAVSLPGVQNKADAAEYTSCYSSHEQITQRCKS